MRTTALRQGFFDSGFKMENAFFSGSVKENTLPFNYPFTVIEPLDNTQGSMEKTGGYSGKVVAVRGFIAPLEYQKYIERFNPPSEFTRYRNSFPFPFWSSPALTYALVVNVMSKYHCLLTSEEKQPNETELYTSSGGPH